ncbi:A1pp-domain-containing protein [Cryphonectria parasitica EP155]|uniref:A1pp-domain-containing protein n=1 Tax=Cryphonectria parasitica (strain ATCC 38755 / EP155) TaxID=660469 RepID=A0A9P5CQ77_CRYP1|nr:A1pp-domain-containing protein [Cryphonectria parasitica EP155]KAF3766938.1 A1pp-domain-containing protein [Cryphonectria parasitica EP155]
MSVLSAKELPTLSLLYKLGKLIPAQAGTKVPTTLSFRSTEPIAPSKALNDRVCLVRHDITKLAVDAITNAANRRLLGGGGIDGAIHAAAGPDLLAECRKLGGCATGSAKITGAHRLPCQKVIHAVGPMYDLVEPEESEELLTSAYNTVLNLAVDNGCKSLALCGISTGIYGYPPFEAAPVAISAVKKFLEGEKGQKLEKVVFVTWVKQDVDSYEEFLPSSTTDTAEAAQAKEVASKLPDVPRSEPGDSEHPEKKQKQ